LLRRPGRDDIRLDCLRASSRSGHRDTRGVVPTKEFVNWMKT
jgi:hypothetical protein